MSTLQVEMAGAARVRETSVVRRSLGEHAAVGMAARAEVPRSAHTTFEALPGRPDPMSRLAEEAWPGGRGGTHWVRADAGLPVRDLAAGRR